MQFKLIVGSLFLSVLISFIEFAPTQDFVFGNITVTGTCTGCGDGPGAIITGASVGGAGETIGATSTFYTSFGFASFLDNALNSTEANRATFMSPAAGTLSDLVVLTDSTQPATGNMVITLRRNTSTDTAVTITIAAGATANFFNSGATSAAISTNDVLTLRFVNNATSASAVIRNWSARIQ